MPLNNSVGNMAGVVFVTAVIAVGICPIVVTSDCGVLPELEKVDLEVPVEFRTKYPFNSTRTLVVPKGYGIRVYALVSNARFLLALRNGDALVSQPQLSSISLLQSSWNSSVQRANILKFITGLNQPHDMVLFKDKNGDDYIYIAETNRISRYRYTYTQENSTIGTPEVLVDNLSTSIDYGHVLKNIAVGNNTLYVSIASSTNASPQDLKKDPKRGAIYGYSLNGGERRLVSEGIRNAEGLAFVPGTNELWVVVNQRDDVKYPYNDTSGNYGKVVPEYVDNNPPEQFCKIEEGANYGWPYCNPVPSDSMNNLEYVADVDANPNESVVKCDSFRKVDKGMEPHSAPLGLSFWSGNNVSCYFQNGALVAMHGSWDRRSFSGHKVVFYPWVNGKPGDVYNLVSGWVDDAVKKVRWGRPVDTAILQDGSVLISDDFAGAVYQLYKKSV